MRHLERVTVRNFQAVQEATFELGRVNVLLGETNQGKSSLLRALQALFYNRAGHDCVHTGAEFAEVTGTFSDGTVVTWQKGAKVNRYLLNGAVYDKVATGVPEEVREALGIWEVAFDKDMEEQLHYAHQHAPAFLVDPSWSGSRVSKVLGKLSSVGPVLLAIRETSNDLKRVKQEIESDGRAKERVSRELSDFAGLDAELARQEAVEGLWERVKALGARKDALEALAGRRAALLGEVAAWRAKAERFPSVNPEALSGRVEAYRQMLKCQENLDRTWRRWDEAETGLGSFEAREGQAKGALETWRKQQGVCPVCEGRMGA